jgi:hypothetical protein
MSALGVHEVIIESPDHVTDMSTLSDPQITDILRAYRARLRILGTDPRWRYLLIYKNQGEHAGGDPGASSLPADCAAHRAQASAGRDQRGEQPLRRNRSLHLLRDPPARVGTRRTPGG